MYPKIKIYQNNLILVFTYLFVIQQSNCGIYEYMTQDESQQIFHTDEPISDFHEAKLFLDTVTPNTYSALSFNAFGENQTIMLKLHEPTLIGDNTPIWLGSYNLKKRKPVFEKLKQHILGDIVKLYETPEGSIIGCGINKYGAPYCAGSVGNLTISPVPTKVSREIHRRRRNILQNEPTFLDKNKSNKYVETDYHIVSKTSQLSDNIPRLATIETDIFEQQNDHIKLKKWKRQVLDNDTTIYPEILLLTSFHSLTINPRDPSFNKLIIYLIAFWNNVALHFKTLKNPCISLRITGIVIYKELQAAPFLSKNKSPNNHIFIDDALSDMKTWLSDNQQVFPVQTYDIAIVMTDRKLCQKKNDKCFRSNTLGVANIGAKCAFNSTTVEMCAIVHDEVDFHGVLTATHELAHVLGAKHDGFPTKNCNSRDLYDHYIMSPVAMRTPQNFVWSNCSRQLLSSHWWNNSNNCLNINSTLNTGKTVSIILPADVTPLDKQCMERGYHHACDPSATICKNLECEKSSNSEDTHQKICHKTGPPLNGSKCGPNHHCILGICTARNATNENV